VTASLNLAHTVTKLPVRDLDRACAFYRDRLGLEPAEARDGGLRYVCGDHLFVSAGTASGEATQMGFEVADIDAVVADLHSRGVQLESFEIPDLETQDGIVVVPDNYPSKGTGERAAFLRDSEGNLLAIAQATR
jgi:catechol 2,3-dioxygenase-like lactoylglutathione lyase family enzyme